MGNPSMPTDVCEAKEIHRLTIEKSEGVTGSEDEPFATDNAKEYTKEEEDTHDDAGEVAVEDTDNVAVEVVAHGSGAEGVACAAYSVGCLSKSKRLQCII